VLVVEIENADGITLPIHPRAELHREITVLCL